MARVLRRPLLAVDGRNARREVEKPPPLPPAAFPQLSRQQPLPAAPPLMAKKERQRKEKETQECDAHRQYLSLSCKVIWDETCEHYTWDWVVSTYKCTMAGAAVKSFVVALTTADNFPLYWMGYVVDELICCNELGLNLGSSIRLLIELRWTAARTGQKIRPTTVWHLTEDDGSALTTLAKVLFLPPSPLIACLRKRQPFLTNPHIVLHNPTIANTQMLTILCRCRGPVEAGRAQTRHHREDSPCSVEADRQSRANQQAQQTPAPALQCSIKGCSYEARPKCGVCSKVMRRASCYGPWRQKGLRMLTSLRLLHTGSLEHTVVLPCCR